MIKLEFKKAGDFAAADKALFGRSKWWGFPDMPEDLDWPETPVAEGYEDPLTFVCQIRCSDLVDCDPEGYLPHEGMLYFFAALDYFLGDLDAALSPGLGAWDPGFFRVLYSPTCEDLHTHSLLYDDGSPAALPAEEIIFSQADSDDAGYGFCLLGRPFYDEVVEANPGRLSLLQVDESDDWDLRFFDCGMLNFLISPKNLAARKFSSVRCWLTSA